MSTYQHAAHERRGWGRWVALAVGLLVAAFVGAFAWDAMQLRSAADDLRSHAAAAKNAVSARDAAALSVEVGAVSDAARRFADATSGPHWWIASQIPWLKDQTRPLSEAGAATLAIAEGALEPLGQMGSLEALEVPEMKDGRIDPFALEEYREPLTAAADVIAQQGERLEAVSLEGTISQVQAPFRELRGQLGVMGELITGGAVAAQLLPDMLGADGPRTYAVVVQNNAEPRPTGGIPGAFLRITVKDGEFELGDYASASALNSRDLLDFDLTSEEEGLWGVKMLRYVQDANFTPEFPRTAQLVAAYWTRAFGEDVDGVVSLDPVALGYLLGDADPIEVGPASITGANAAEVLLRDSYLLFPEPGDQDDFFALAAGAIFDQIVAGGASIVDGAERSIEEGRFTVWSAHEDEQALLATTAVGGAFLSKSDTAGVFLSDGSGSKIGYYVDWSVTVEQTMCAAGTVDRARVTVELDHAFDGDVGSLPWYVSGGGMFVPEGEFHGNVILYVPEGWGITGVAQDGQPAGMHPALHGGKTRGAVWVELQPGASSTLVFDVAAPRGANAPVWSSSPRANAGNIALNYRDAEQSC